MRRDIDPATCSRTARPPRPPAGLRAAAALLLAPLLAWACGEEAAAPEEVDTGVIVVTVLVDGDAEPDVGVQLNGPVSSSAATNENGTIVFAALPLGSYTVDVVGIPPDVVLDREMDTVTLDSDGQTVEIPFIGTRRGRIVGTVTVGGQGLGGVRVSATGQEIEVSWTTGEDGSYTSPGLPAGDYTVMPGGPEVGACDPAQARVTLQAAGETTADFDCEAP